jgi:N-acetylmuramoyl-L-alanine amidase
MSASSNSAGFALIKQETAPVPTPATQTPSPPSHSGHEALQALLAFSALHEQIRTRRAERMRDASESNLNNDWQVEQFVLDEVLQLVAERALAITGADGVAIALAEDDAIVCRASAGTIAPDAGVRLDPRSGFSGECLISGRIVRCDDAENDPRVNLQACRRLGVRSLLAVPLSAKQSVVGLVEAFASEPYGFNDSDVRSLNLLAELILSAMKPEEEDRLSEISRRVVSAVAVEPETKVPPAENLDDSAEPPSSATDSINTGAPRLVPFETRESHSEPVSEENSKSSDPPATPSEHKELDRSRPGLAVVAAVVLFAVALGAAVWWTVSHRTRAGTPTAHSVTSVPAAPATTIARPGAPAAPAVPEANKPEVNKEDESESSPPTPETAGLLPQVTGIRHWSSAESSTIVIDLQDQVQYEAHRLPNPERIYFDLQDTTLAANFSSRAITVNDGLLQRVRIAQPRAGVTRVVLETNGASDFSVSLQPNPYRLVVEVRKTGSPPRPQASIDLFTPANPASLDQAATKLAPANQVPADHKQLNQVSLNQIPLKPIPQSPAAVDANVGANKDKRPATSSEPLSATPIHAPKFRIALDAGHGGWDLGGVGRQGLLEKDLVLDIVKRLGYLVESRLGAEVIYTRKDDSYLALEKRAEIANLAQANLFVSVHANYSDYPSARGVETYYTNTYSSVKARTEEADDSATPGPQSINWTNVDIREKVHESRRVAASVQHALYAMLSADNPGLRNRGVKQAQYVVLTGTSMPAILAEVSFVSSPTDENNLQSTTYRQQIAEALYTGIAHYQASNRNVKMATAAKPTGR